MKKALTDQSKDFQQNYSIDHDTVKLLKFIDPKGLFVFQTFADKKDAGVNLTRNLYGTIEQHGATLDDLNKRGAGVFFTVNETLADSRKAADITRVRALWVDFDKENKDRVSTLTALPFPPNLIIESSKDKHHAYWVFNEGEIPLNQFSELQKRLIHLFAADGADNIHDLPRVMRLAGFHHNKKDAFKSRICHIGQHYTAATVVTWVESLPKPIEQQVQHTHTVKPLQPFSFNLNADVEANEVIDALRYISPDCDYHTWYRIGAAIYNQFGMAGFDIWDSWSKQSSRYNAPEMVGKFRGFATLKAVNIGTLFYFAQANGWKKQNHDTQIKQAVLQRAKLETFDFIDTSEKTTQQVFDLLTSEENSTQVEYLAQQWAYKILPSIPYKNNYEVIRANLTPLNYKLSDEVINQICLQAEKSLAFKKKMAIASISLNNTQGHDHTKAVTLKGFGDKIRSGLNIYKAQTGVGKTREIGKPFADLCRGDNKQFLAIAHRKSLIDELSNVLGTEHYEGIGKTPSHFIDLLSTTVNSLANPKFDKFMNTVKHVFIDEITQVLAAFNSATTFVGGKERAFEVFKQLIANAECLVIADANINDETIAFFEMCRPNERFNIVEVAPKDEKKEAILYEDKDDVTARVINDVMGLGSKVWITCDSQSEVRKIGKVLSEHYGIDTLIIHKDTKSKAVHDFFKAPENESLKYQVVISTPKISSGLSITHEHLKHFDYVAGIFTGVTVSSLDAYQMLGRIRYIKEFHLFIDQKKNAFSKDIGESIKAREVLAGIEGGTQKATALTDLIIRTESNSNRDRNNFGNNLFYVLEHYKFSFRRAKYQADYAIKAELKQCGAEIKEADKAGILSAARICEDQANSYRKRLYLNQSEVWELAAYNKRMYLNLPFDAVLTEEHLEINMAQVRRFNAIFGNGQGIKDKDLDLALRRYLEASGAICRDVLKDLNITGGAYINNSNAANILKRFEPYIKNLAEVGFIPSFFLTCSTETKTPFKRLALLLAHWGIEIDRVNNPLLLKNSDTLRIISIDISNNLSENDGEKVYRIRESSMVQMFDLVKTHLLGGKDVPLKPIEINQTTETPLKHDAVNSDPYHVEDIPIRVTGWG